MLTTQPEIPRKIRVMLVDDSAILLSEAIPFLNQHPWVEVVGSVYKASNAVAHAQLLSPDIVLLDITIRGVNGLPVLRRLHEVNPALPVIVLDEVVTEPVRRAALRNGAAAFVGKLTAKTDLLPAILATVRSDERNA